MLKPYTARLSTHTLNAVRKAAIWATLLTVALSGQAAFAFDLNPFASVTTARGATTGPGHASQTWMEVGTSPRGHAMDLAVKVIDNARRSLDIAAYEFTSRRIANAVRAALARGVVVRIAVDAKENVGRRNSIAYELASAGAQVRYIDTYPIMHDKIEISDADNVETGSLNYTAAADLHNRENALVIWNNPQLAAVYEADFEDLWSLGHPLH